MGEQPVEILTRCPCCGHAALFDRPLVDLTDNTVSYRGHVVRVSPMVADMLAILVANYPKRITRDNLISKLWGFGQEPNSAENVIRIMAFRARNALRPAGVEVRGSRERGYGVILN